MEREEEGDLREMAFKPGDKFIIEIKEVTNNGFLFHGIPKRLYHNQLMNLTQVEEVDDGYLLDVDQETGKKYKEVLK